MAKNDQIPASEQLQIHSERQKSAFSLVSFVRNGLSILAKPYKFTVALKEFYIDKTHLRYPTKIEADEHGIAAYPIYGDRNE